MTRLVLLGIFLSLLAASAARAEGRWGIGVRATAMDIAGGDAVSPTSLTGSGFHIRFRLVDRLAFELASEHIGVEREGVITRDAAPVTISALLTLSRGALWDSYVIVGAGRVVEEVTFTRADRTTTTEVVDESLVHIGLGVERRLGPLAIDGELRAVNLARTEEVAAQGVSSLIPNEASAFQVSLAATWYF